MSLTSTVMMDAFALFKIRQINVCDKMNEIRVYDAGDLILNDNSRGRQKQLNNLTTQYTVYGLYTL